MRKCFFLVMLVIPGMVITGAAGEASRARAFRVTQPPGIDGKLDDAAWRALPMTTGFVYTRQPDTYAAPEYYQTEMRVGWDDKALYIALEGVEPRLADHLKHAEKKVTGKANWKYQLYEVLLDPKIAGGRDHYQFAFDILGKKVCYQADLKGEKQANWNRGIEWKEVEFPWRGAVHHGSDSFSMELVFQFEGFGGTPEPGEEWGFLVGRSGTWSRPGIHWKLAGVTCLPPIASGHFKNWREHGALEFVPEALLDDYENVGKKTEAINAEYYIWKATQGEAMKKVRKLLAKTEGEVDLLRVGNDGKPARIRAFGHGRRPTPEKPPDQFNRNWWTNNDGNPRTIVCSWEKPVTVNLHHVDWLGPESYASEYMLEYWTEDGWQLAYAEEDNPLPLSCHEFPAITTDKLRFTITRMETRDYYLSIQKFELYRVEADGQGGAK